MLWIWDTFRGLFIALPLLGYTIAYSLWGGEIWFENLMFMLGACMFLGIFSGLFVLLLFGIFEEPIETRTERELKRIADALEDKTA